MYIQTLKQANRREVGDYIFMKERWKRIKGYDSYEVSDRGRIKSNVYKEPRILKTWTNQHGHQYVGITDNRGNKKKVLVHRMVAETFIDNPNNYPIVRHLNDIPDDNRVRNLAWGTQHDNHMDAKRNISEYCKNIYCYELDRTFNSCADAAEYFGVCRASITQCCSGKSFSVKGFHMCYLKDYDEFISNIEDEIRTHNHLIAVRAVNIESGEELYFDSVKQAGEILGIPDCGISSVLHGRINSTHGWCFEVVEDE